MSKEEREYSVMLSKREVGSLAWDRSVKLYARWFALTGILALAVMVGIGASLDNKLAMVSLIPVLMFLLFWWKKIGPEYKGMKDELLHREEINDKAAQVSTE